MACSSRREKGKIASKSSLSPFGTLLAHDYFGIDLEAVWDTLRNNIPSFKKEIVKVLKSEKSSERGAQNGKE